MAQTQNGQGVWAVSSGPQTLEEEGIHDHRGHLRDDSLPSGNRRNRCLPVWLGRSMAVQSCQRPMGCPAEAGACKCAGTPCSVLALRNFLPVLREWHVDLIHLHRVSNQPPGVVGDAAAPHIGIPPLSKPEGCTCSKCAEQCSRPSLLPKSTPGGVETPSRGGWHDLGQVWQGRDLFSVCNTVLPTIITHLYSVLQSQCCCSSSYGDSCLIDGFKPLI